MKVSEAISKRILELCSSNNISINKLALMSGLTQSTLQSIIDGKSKNPTILSIARISESLNMNLNEFFNSNLFSNLDLEI